MWGCNCLKRFWIKKFSNSIKWKIKKIILKKKKKNIDGRINELMVEKSNLIEKIKFLES